MGLHYRRLWLGTGIPHYTHRCGDPGQLACLPLSVGGGEESTSLPMSPGHGPLHISDWSQGQPCHCLWGILRLHTDPPGENQPNWCLEVLEEVQGGLCHPGVHAHKTNILPSTPERKILHHAAYQWWSRCRSRSVGGFRHRYSPHS